jgi:hypothetical protein
MYFAVLTDMLTLRFFQLWHGHYPGQHAKALRFPPVKTRVSRVGPAIERAVQLLLQLARFC